MLKAFEAASEKKPFTFRTTAESDIISAYKNNLNEISLHVPKNKQRAEYKIDLYYLQVSGGGSQKALPVRT